MLNRIIYTSLRHRLAVVLAAGMLLVGGMVALLNSEIDVFPDLNAPTVVVMTEAPGIAPEEIERAITYPVETAVNGVTGVRRVRSTSSTGYSTVAVEFEWGTDVYHARQLVAERISQLQGTLPQGAGVPTIGPQSSIMGEVLIIGLTSRRADGMELRTLADRDLKPRLLSVPGVAQVNVMGGSEREVAVKLHPQLMMQYGVTLDEVMQATRSMNLNAVGGIIDDYGHEYLVKGVVATDDPALLADNVVAVREGGAAVRLGDIATVEVAGKRPVIGVASVRGEPAVLITVTKQPGVGTIELNERLLQVVESARTAIPADIDIATDIFSQSTFIERSVNNLQVSLMEGALFVVVVLFLFLMNVRTTLISVVSLPVSIVITILVLNALHISINTMTLGGIAIAIGSLVDDAIVDVENVYKRLRENAALPPAQRREPREVIYSASAEVRVPVINSTLIIMASFLPLFFLDGMEGRMLIPLGVSFIVALVSSTVVALTLTPALCSYMLGGKKRAKKGDGTYESAAGGVPCGGDPWLMSRLKTVYGRSLRWVMRRRRAVCVATAVLLVGGVALFFMLGRSFLPPFNEGSFTINISAMPGISLEESDRLGRVAEELILSVPEVQTVARKTGRAALDEHALGSNVSEIEAPYILSGRSRGDVARELRQKLGSLPGVNVEIGQPISHRLDAMLSGTEAQVAVKLFGDDLPVLAAKGNEMRRAMMAIDGLVDVNVEQLTGRPQLDIVPDREMLALYGITASELREYLGVALQGEVVSTVYDGEWPCALRVVVDPTATGSIEELGNLTVNSSNGPVPLSSLAAVKSVTGPNAINREGVRRRIVVSANVEGRDLGSAVKEIKEKLDANVTLPQGYYYTLGGQFESEQRASHTLMGLSLLSLLIILLLLQGEFHNVRQSLVIMVNMPIAVVGGIVMLAVTGAEVNIPAIIGFISLMGISTRNGMLLMSRYNQLRDSGVALQERIAAGSADRLTPILMTALTSALALIPLALRAGEAGNEIQAPMATVILGGLITSTLLNVYIVPVIYSYIAHKDENKA